MYDAAKEGDVTGIAACLAHGAIASWANRNDDGKTALHACALLKKAIDDSPGQAGGDTASIPDDSWRGIECAELLIQNGAKIDVRDKQSQGVLDAAVIGNADHHMIEYLSGKLG